MRRKLWHAAGEPGQRPLLLIALLTALPSGVMEFLLPLYGRAVAASAVEIGTLFSATALLGLALRPLAGMLADRGHPVRLLIAGVAGQLLALLSYAVAGSYATLLLARLLQAGGAILSGVALYVLLAAASGERERGRAFGRLTSLVFAGYLVGGVLAALVLLRDQQTQAEVRSTLAALGLQLPLPAPVQRLQALHLLYALYGLFAAAALLPALALRRMHSSPAQAPAAALPEPAIDLLRQRSTARLLLVGLLLGLGYTLAIPMLPLLLQDRFGSGLASLAIAYLIPGLLYAALPGLLGRRADHWGVARASSAGLLLRALVYALLPLAPTLPLLAALWSLEAAGFSLSSPALTALLSRASTLEQRGRMYGLYGLAAGIGSIAGGALGGWLYQHAGVATPFWCHALLLALAALIVPRAKARGLAAPGP